jgi:hypothetical protein
MPLMIRKLQADATRAPKSASMERSMSRRRQIWRRFRSSVVVDSLNSCTEPVSLPYCRLSHPPDDPQLVWVHWIDGGCVMAMATRVKLLVGVPIVGLLAAGAAFAAIPETTPNVIHGCYSDFGGQLRIVTRQSEWSCRPHETPLSWNRQGVQGPPSVGGLSPLARADKTDPVTEPMGVRVGSAAFVLLDAPFTMSKAEFVHLSAFGSISFGTASSCTSHVTKPELVAQVQNTDASSANSLWARTIVSVDEDLGQAHATVADDVWLPAGRYTASISYFPRSCNAPVDTPGSVSAGDLHVRVSQY